MSVPSKFALTGVLLLVLAGLGTGGVLVARHHRKKTVDEFPPCPFHPLPAGLKWRNWDALMASASEEDRPVLQAIKEKKYVRALDLAATGLAKNPDSVPLRFAVAYSLHNGEGDLPEALYILRQVRHYLEAAGQRNPDDETAREWYHETLEAEGSLLRDMNRYGEVLRVADLIDAVGPKDKTIRLWALMKEKRYEEAERAIAEAEQDPDPWVRLNGMNTRLAMEEERRRRTAGFEAARKARDAYPGSAVINRNFGESALLVFDFPTAEKAFRKAAKLPLDFYGTAWLDLAELMLQSGRANKVYDALKKAQHQRMTREVFTRQQDEARFETTFAAFLMVLGKSEDAELRARRIVENPDRGGHTSTDKIQLELQDRLLLWLALEMRVEQLREEIAADSWASRALPDKTRVALEAEAWTERCRILRLVADEELLEGNLRPYLSGNPSPWMAAALVELLPPGAALEAVRRARAAEEEARTAPYFDALEAEVALRLSRYDDAARLARQAIEGLSPDGEKLLRARLSAVAAEALRRKGRMGEAREFLATALIDFPGVTRMLGIAIPVRIEHDGSDLGRRLSEALSRSPRFRSDPEGFPVRVGSDGSQLWFSMDLPNGQHHFEREGVAIEADAKATVLAAVRRFHQRVMSPKIDLTPDQINSLDGLQSANKSQADGLLGPSKEN